MEIENKLSVKALYDLDLVKKAADHCDQAAFAELHDRYRESVYFLLLKMVNNQDDAEDLTIEAFGKAFKNIAQYTPNYAFSTWLFRIATNNCIDFIRKKRAVTMSLDKAFMNSDGSELTMDIRSDGPDPEENYIKKQKNKLMRELVQKLKPRYRTLIEMRYFQEMSYEEIAEQLDLPIGTVKAQLFRSREFLYNMLRNKQDRI
ncbi:MAG: RNA polymerase sigma factor [Flavobacteriales bacterium]